MDTDELKYCLLHLHLLHHNIKNVFDSLRELGKSNLNEINSHAQLVVWSSIMEILVIKSSSYQDELNELKKLASNEELKEIIEFVKGQIKEKWPDLKDYRNQIVAHPFRKRSINFKSVFSQDLIVGYSTPTSMDDFSNIAGHLAYIHKLLEDEYPDIFKSFLDKSFPPIIK